MLRNPSIPMSARPQALAFANRVRTADDAVSMLQKLADQRNCGPQRIRNCAEHCRDGADAKQLICPFVELVSRDETRVSLYEPYVTIVQQALFRTPRALELLCSVVRNATPHDDVELIDHVGKFSIDFARSTLEARQSAAMRFILEALDDKAASTAEQLGAILCLPTRTRKPRPPRQQRPVLLAADTLEPGDRHDNDARNF
jgi:hypothetical protein